MVISARAGSKDIAALCRHPVLSPFTAPHRPAFVNDVHSQLNGTRVAAVIRPQSVFELQTAVKAAVDEGIPVSVCGGRHSMGGQQFARHGILIDLTALNRVIDLDAERGLVTVEAGIEWPALIAHLVWAGASRPDAWSIIQKQTGADRMTLGGALASNIHGRGLRLRPIISDVEEFELVDPHGSLIRCSRTLNPELFALAIGGYGLRLLLLSHTNKSRAFADYARHYMSTDGQVYWSDTHQLGVYIDCYHEDLDRRLASRAKGSEMISELYVPRHCLPSFMASVRRDALRHHFDIIYGTIRLIERDDESLLAWAREPWACVVFNLHVDHTPEGIGNAADHFRCLIDRAIEQGGSYYLTYHRWATAGQAQRCHPRLREFLERKRLFDPDGVFQSDWYRHHVDLLAGR